MASLLDQHSSNSARVCFKLLHAVIGCADTGRRRRCSPRFHVPLCRVFELLQLLVYTTWKKKVYTLRTSVGKFRTDPPPVRPSSQLMLSSTINHASSAHRYNAAILATTTNSNWSSYAILTNEERIQWATAHPIPGETNRSSLGLPFNYSADKTTRLLLLEEPRMIRLSATECVAAYLNHENYQYSDVIAVTSNTQPVTASDLTNKSEIRKTPMNFNLSNVASTSAIPMYYFPWLWMCPNSSPNTWASGIWETRL